MWIKCTIFYENANYLNQKKCIEYMNKPHKYGKIQHYLLKIPA